MKRTHHRPEPITQSLEELGATPIDKSTRPAQAAARLLDGETLMLTDTYSLGAEVLAALGSMLGSPGEQASYPQRQAASRHLRAVSMRLLAPIVDHRLALRDARSIGFLKELYRGLPTFSLPFIQAQELRGAWLAYKEGVHLAVLGHKLHPFYGTYVPTRTTHLELFGTWLSQHEGRRNRAIDVGTGCGVLAMMLCRAGFEAVLATDNNPNAIESVTRDIQRMDPKPPITLAHGDLFAGKRAPADLIVFNPPWIQGEAERLASGSLIDAALTFKPGLFERFFEHASTRLEPEGRLVVVFSNIIQLLQPELPHPVLHELEGGRYRLVNKLQRKVRATPSKSGQRRRTRERVEVWELALV